MRLRSYRRVYDSSLPSERYEEGVTRVKVALVIPELNKQGGTERCVASLGEALAARGHTIAIVSSKRQDGLLPRATWYRVPIIPRPHVIRFLSFMLGNTLIRMWLRLFRSERFDVIHSTGPDVLRPTVTTLHCCGAGLAEGVWRDRTSGGKRWRRLRRLSNAFAYQVVSLCERYVLRRGAARVITVSLTLTRELHDRYRRLPADRLVVVPDGVDLREFHSGIRADGQSLRRALQVPEDGLVVLFVGHNWGRKGLETLVSALHLIRRHEPQLRPWLVVVGEGGRQLYAEAIQRRLDGDVKFLGVQSAMGPIYGMADVCVLPSTYEPFGLPILEAMACGVPAIVSECAGVAEIVKHGTDGLLLKNPEDVEELAAKLECLLRDNDLRRSLGDLARQTAEQYSWDIIAEKVEALYCSAVAERS